MGRELALKGKDASDLNKTAADLLKQAEQLAEKVDAKSGQAIDADRLGKQYFESLQRDFPDVMAALSDPGNIDFRVAIAMDLNENYKPALQRMAPVLEKHGLDMLLPDYKDSAYGRVNLEPAPEPQPSHATQASWGKEGAAPAALGTEIVVTIGEEIEAEDDGLVF